MKTSLSDSKSSSDSQLILFNRERPSHTAYQRDELNLAEFPLSIIGKANGEKTLEFEDTVFDRSRNQPITRKLTIAASEKYGLPTGGDEDVLLALIQLTAKQKFSSRKVFFSRYELLQELGWPDSGKSYKRIEEALKRWMGCTVYYDNAWRNKETGTWSSVQFHFLEEAEILDRDQIRLRRTAAFASGRSAQDQNYGKSYFVWSSKIFESFAAGNLKLLDYEFLKSLKSSVLKRIYRFLDKRFYQRENWTFELYEFACVHIGYSRNYKPSKLKKLLVPHITELERRGFLEPMTYEERFPMALKVSNIHFKKAQTSSSVISPEVVGESRGSTKKNKTTSKMHTDSPHTLATVSTLSDSYEAREEEKALYELFLALPEEERTTILTQALSAATNVEKLLIKNASPKARSQVEAMIVRRFFKNQESIDNLKDVANKT